MSRSNSPALLPPQLGEIPTDWLGKLIFGAKQTAAATEFATFPYINSTAASVVAVLEAIENVEKNKDHYFKDLANDITPLLILFVLRFRLTETFQLLDSRSSVINFAIAWN